MGCSAALCCAVQCLRGVAVQCSAYMFERRQAPHLTNVDGCVQVEQAVSPTGLKVSYQTNGLEATASTAASETDEGTIHMQVGDGARLRPTLKCARAVISWGGSRCLPCCLGAMGVPQTSPHTHARAHMRIRTGTLQFRAPHTLVYDTFRKDGTRSKLLAYCTPSTPGT